MYFDSFEIVIKINIQSKHCLGNYWSQSFFKLKEMSTCLLISVSSQQVLSVKYNSVQRVISKVDVYIYILTPRIGA